MALSPEFCYPNYASLNTTSSKCHFNHDITCQADGSLEILLAWGDKVSHIIVADGLFQTNYALYDTYVNNGLSYTYTINATGSNPTTWNTQTYHWICDIGIVETYDASTSEDPPDWYQGCYGQSPTTLNFDKIYVYYKGHNYDQVDIQNQYAAFKQWLAPFTFTGQDYHTIIGGGGARWLDWVSSCFNGIINNGGVNLNGGGPITANRSADTTAWEDWGTGNSATGIVGDIHLWSHNDSTVDDFYSHMPVGQTTSTTNTGASITSLGLPPIPNSSDKILILIFNDESACTYHGKQAVANITVNGITYPNGIEFNGQCEGIESSIIDGNTENWKNDHITATALLASHIASGGVDVVLWPSLFNNTSSNQPQHNSYALHVSAAIHSTDGTGMFPVNAVNYFSDWTTGSAPASSLWCNDITTCIPVWNAPPGMNPNIRRLETANPYALNYGKLDAFNVTYPFNFPGTQFQISSQVATSLPGLSVPNTIPDWPGMFNNVINYQLSNAVTNTVPCQNENCVTLQVIDISTGLPLPNYPISTDLNGIPINIPSTLLTTDANGELNFQAVNNSISYIIAGTTLTFPGNCLEYLVQVYAGKCEYTPIIDCQLPCGCTDSTAINYNSSVTCDDGSCIYPPPCDVAYGEYNPIEFLTDSDIKRIEIEAIFSDSVYKKFQAMRFGMTSPCETTLDKIVTKKYLCFWEDKKEKEYLGFKIDRTVYKPIDPTILPEAGTYPSWVDPLCGLIEKGNLTVYFFYDGTSLGLNPTIDIYTATELWMQTLATQGFVGSHYHTIVAGERWLDWATTAITGQFNNAGTNCNTALPDPYNADPVCNPPNSCYGGCYAPSNGATGECGCHGNTAYDMSYTLKIKDWFQNSDCSNPFYDNYINGTTCTTWIGPDGFVPQGTTVTWNGPPPVATTEQVLIICFADETEVPFASVSNDINYACYHNRGNTNGSANDWNVATIGGNISPAWKADYNKYIDTYNTWISKSCNHSLNCFLYTSRPVNIYQPQRAFPLHAIGAISSGNRPTKDGTFLTGTAPINLMANTSIAAIELPGSNLYWNEVNTVTLHPFGYGGLDNYGWSGNYTSDTFTESTFASDLNSFFSLSLYECKDNECLIFDVVNQNGTAIKDYQIYLDGKDVGKTNEIGRYTHVISNASINTEHTAQLCECFTTSGNCAQQRLLITVTELCPDPVCITPAPQCTCNAPGNSYVTIKTDIGINTFKAYVTWSETNTTETTVTYELRYRIVGTTTWTTVNTANLYYIITGLNYDTEYEFQVRATCGTLISCWNAIQMFTTPSACPIIECFSAICISSCQFNLRYAYTSLGNLQTSITNGTTGTWGVIYGTNSNLTIGNITTGGQITNLMVPGLLTSYPGNGVVNTVITETPTNLAPFTTYYWRAYMNPNPDINGCLDDIIYSPICDSFTTGDCPLVPGCTDPLATNYNAFANIDDGTCNYCIIYPIITESHINVTSSGANDGSITVTITNPITPPYIYSWTGPNGYTATTASISNLADGTYILTVTDAAGCTSVITVELIVCVYGCMDASATNYDPAATCPCLACCVPEILGCTDPLASNYNPAANTDDGSCDYCTSAYVQQLTSTTLTATDPTLGIVNGGYYTIGTYSMIYNSIPLPVSQVTVTASYNGNTYNEGDVIIFINCVYPPIITVVDNITGCIATTYTIPLSYGCMEPTASNYNPSVMCGDNSCTWLGCTDPTASNYVPFPPEAYLPPYNGTSIVDDGSCCIDGCTDPRASNYDPAATCDDGSCTYTCNPCSGPPFPITAGCCQNPLASNYNPFATCDDGSCCIDGCTDPAATNYDPAATCDDRSCIYGIPGCTDPTACNYDPAATFDDGSCIVQGPPPIIACYEIATWNATSCVYDVTGTQPVQPPVVNCWDTFVFNNTTCVWDNTGIAPDLPPFIPIGPLCQNSVAPALPATSTNGIPGTWSPTTISTAILGTTVYTFTPDPTLCGVTTTMNISIDPPTTNGDVTTSICDGDSYIWPLPLGTGLTYTTAQTNVTNIVGCNTATLNLTVNPLPTITGTAIVCIGLTTTLTGSATAHPTTPWSSATPTVATVTNAGVVTGVSAGTSVITYMNSNNCITTVTITVTLVITPDFTFYTDVCYQYPLSLPTTSNNGITGTWSPAYNNTALPGTSTTYTFTPDAGQCATTQTSTITILPCDGSNSCYGSTVQVNNHVSCFGAFDGSATAYVVSSFGNDYWLWSDGQTSSTAVGLAAGTYTYTIYSNPGTVGDPTTSVCTTTGSVTIIQPTQLSISLEVRDVFPGQTNGAVLATVTGGTAPYTYVWSDALAQTTNPATGLSLGPIAVTVTDCNGCTVTDSAFVLINIVGGCTDPLSPNYSFAANTDDGSCYIPLSGLTYIPDANFRAALVATTTITTNDWVDYNGASSTSGEYVLTTVLNTVTFLDVDNLNIADLTGIEAFTALTYLICYQNQLTSLNLSQNTALTTLYCWDNQLTSLDVSQNTALTTLHCGYNQLTSLDVRNGNNTNFSNFYAYGNPNLTCISVDDATWSTANWTDPNYFAFDSQHFFSNNCNPLCGCMDPAACNYDPLATYDDGSCNTVYGCTDATACNYVVAATCDDGSCTYPDGCTDVTACNYNPLATCDDGSCSGLLGCTNVTANNYNSSATCDDGSCTYDPISFTYGCGDPCYANYDPSPTIIHDINLCSGIAYCTIPDINFRNALINHSCWYMGGTPISTCNITAGDFVDANNDGNFDQIEICKVNTITYLTDLFSKNISSLQGIECFTALKYLDCYDNQITSVDLSQNTALIRVLLNDNQLTSLNLNGLTALTKFWCDNNQLQSLDVSTNTALTEFICSFNQLTSLNVSQNTALFVFWCHVNQLQSLDLSQNTALALFICSENQLTSLDVQYNTGILYLVCNDNQITSLDVSYCTSMTQLICKNNQLTYLDVRNGNNYNFVPQAYWSGIPFKSTNNPNLTCIHVDDAAYSTANWTVANGQINSQQYFSNNCGVGCTDPTACNYDVTAITDDGSCCYTWGCTDPTATNQDPLACCDDGSCTYIVNTIWTKFNKL